MAVVLAAALLLCWNLGTRYLWQDEAATAEMAERMLRYGKPLAYDGRNLITMDTYDAKLADKLASLPPREVIAILVERGDFKADTTWIGQPWGQFVASAITLAAFGKTTLAARLPFALCGIATVVILFRMVLRWFDDWPMALVAVLLLLTNVFWVLHVRQCRYYALSSLFLLLTFGAYLRWSDGKRWGRWVFVVFAWCLFQCDYGSFWPVIGVLCVHAIWSGVGGRWRSLLTFAVLGLFVAPWIYYYELATRMKPRYASLQDNILSSLFNFNQFQLPLLALALLPIVLLCKTPQSAGRRVAALAACICLALLVWVPVVSPYPFYRYLMPATPLAALVLAYVVLGMVDLVFGGRAANDLRVVVGIAIAAVLALTPLVALPVALAIPAKCRTLSDPGTLIRPELSAMYLDLVADGPDPNRDLIVRLGPELKPGDEVLVNYEDVPFMFYTDATVRGGMCAFRTEAPDQGHLRFAVIRPNLRIGHNAVLRELARHRLRASYDQVPALPWGNIPDPKHHRFQLKEQPAEVMVHRILGPREPGSSETPVSPYISGEEPETSNTP
ncbi:MAG: ArnT family glycosyltransferase [Pirellulales bacterium]